MTIVLADQYAPGERVCFSDPTVNTKVGWLFPDGKIVWWGRCTAVEWDETLRQLKDQGYDPPIEDRRDVL